MWTVFKAHGRSGHSFVTSASPTILIKQTALLPLSAVHGGLGGTEHGPFEKLLQLSALVGGDIFSSVTSNRLVKDHVATMVRLIDRGVGVNTGIDWCYAAKQARSQRLVMTA